MEVAFSPFVVIGIVCHAVSQQRLESKNYSSHLAASAGLSFVNSLCNSCLCWKKMVVVV